MSAKPANNYFYIFNGLKEKIKQARIKANSIINAQLLQLYWEIGTTIMKEEKSAGWGAKIIDQLAQDLQAEFRDMKGFSVRNLRYMRNFATEYPHFPILQVGLAEFQPSENQNNKILQVDLAKLSWYHHITLLDKIKDAEVRSFYIRKSIEYSWTRDNMVHQIESGLHKRQGTLTHNFQKTIPEYENELVQQLFKDPYKFDFLGIGETARERDLEQALMNQIEKVLLELGDGFALYGRQYKLTAGEKDYYIDLLFYHTKLRRFIVIELKIGEFLPEYVGKMNLYLGLADDSLKGQYDEQTIGLILCKTKNKIVAEYALRDTSKPIGIAEYKINEMLPENIKGELPSIEEIEAKLDQKIESATEEKMAVDEKLQFVKEKLNTLKFSYFLESKKLHIKIEDKRAKISTSLKYVPVNWSEEKNGLGLYDPYYFTLDNFERYLGAVYLESKLEKASAKLKELVERIHEMLKTDGMTEIARRVFNWDNREDKVPAYDDFIRAFESHTGFNKQQYTAEAVGSTIHFTAENTLYEIDSYEGKTAALRSIIDNRSYEEIWIETNENIWSEIYIDAGIEKEKFIPRLIKEWDIYWDDKYERIQKSIGKTSHLDKQKEKSWRNLEMFTQMYNDAGDIIELAHNLDDTELYPLAVITMMQIFNPEVCYSEYCEFEFYSSDEWESIYLDEDKEGNINGTVLYIRPI